MTNYGNELFKGTASYYAKYRPVYPASLIRYLIDKFSLDGKGQMLDVGCGTGQLAMRFSDWFDGIVGIDPEVEMLQEAMRLEKEFRLQNMEWFHGDLDAYRNEVDKEFKLVLIAKAFHWMDRDQVLNTLYDMIALGGGVAIIDSSSRNQALLPWQQTVNDVVKTWYGNERRAGNTTFSHPTVRFEDTVMNSKFELDTVKLPAFTQVWTVDTIIGNLYSTSYASKRFLGDNAVLFEEDLKEALRMHNKEGVFTEEIHTSAILALKKRM